MKESTHSEKTLQELSKMPNIEMNGVFDISDKMLLKRLERLCQDNKVAVEIQRAYGGWYINLELVDEDMYFAASEIYDTLEEGLKDIMDKVTKGEFDRKGVL